MKHLSQDSVVTSSEESQILWESPEFPIEISNHLADSSCTDSVKSSQRKESNGSQSGYTSPKFTKVFPWITNFSQLCQAEIGRYNIHLLENLMTEYLRLITASAAVCRLKPNRAAKLKKIMNSTLILFHFFYSNIKKPLEHSSYFNKMSDLMAIYIDLEITASSRRKDLLLKIASKITSCLYLFLDRSHDHILNSILKTQYLSKNLELCNLIFSRVLRDSPGRAIDEQTYVRYVLAFKLWKQTIKDNDQKKNIVKLACMKLHPPPNFRESVKAGDICGILPNVRKSWSENITMFFMKKNSCVGEMIKSFLKQVNVSEKRGALSSYLTNFDRTPLSNNDTDDSRVSSEEDLEENRGGSSAILNNIWSSMSNDLGGVTHQIQIASIMKGKKKNKNKKTTRKGIATPVFQSDPLTCDITEKLKKKRRTRPMSELTAIKPLPVLTTAEKCSNGMQLASKTRDKRSANVALVTCNVTPVRPRIEPPPPETSFQVADADSCQNQTSSVNVKKEPSDTETSLGVSNICEPTDKSNSDKSGDKSERPSLPEKTNGNVLGETASKGSERLVAAQHPVEDDPARYQRLPQEPSTAQTQNKFSQSSQIGPDQQKESQDPKEFIKKTVERIQESGRSFNKNQNIKCEPEANVQEKSKGILHDQTLRKDFVIFTSQQEFRSNLLSNSLASETAVPSPFYSGGSEETGKRCTCVQCTANETALITNYKTLTQYLESKRTAGGGTASDRMQDLDPASCLPFKKRKTVSVEKEEDEQDGKATSGPRDDQGVSYPNTPMISIAMIDPKVQSLATSLGAPTPVAFPPAIDYSVSSGGSLCYEAQPHHCASEVEQTYPGPPQTDTQVLTALVESLPPLPRSSLPIGHHSIADFKPKFKTPAQLKQCPVSIPVSASLAQSLNFHSDNKKKNSNPVREVSDQRKSKIKTKVDRNLRKRK